MRVWIFVWERTLASAAVPSAPMLLRSRLRTQRRRVSVVSKSEQVGIVGAIPLSAHSLGSGALEALDLRLGQDLGERSRAFAHVGFLEAASAREATE